MSRLTPFVMLALLVSCDSKVSMMDFDTFTFYDDFKLTSALELERSFGSIDKTPGHHILIGEGIFPNEEGYKLETPATFTRIDGKFEEEVEYFYTLPDSSVKVILYQWDMNTSLYSDINISDETKIKEFDEKWHKIISRLNKHLGNPIYEKVESSKLSDKTSNEASKNKDGLDISGDSLDTSWRDERQMAPRPSECLSVYVWR